MASVVKIVIWIFFALVTNSRITHTRFNLCCVALEWVLDFFLYIQKAHNHENFKGVSVHQIPPYNWIQLAK